MKKLFRNSIMVTLVIASVLFYSCQEKEEVNPEQTSELKHASKGQKHRHGHGPNVDLINSEYPEAEAEIRETWEAIVQSIRDGDADKLISFHAYGSKFTEFRDGNFRNYDAENEEFERGFVGAVTEVVKFDAQDMKIAVYGRVANVTFHSDFQVKIGENLVVVRDQTTLLFVDTKDGWKMVHEHHSPLTAE